MATDIRLPPASADLRITINVNKAVRPYLEDALAKNGRPGETIEKFLIRCVVESHIVFLGNKAISDDEATARAALDADNQIVRTQTQDIIKTLP